MKALCIVVALLITCQILLAQHEVSGRVTDARGEPLPMVNVTLRGTSLGVSANEEGRFKIAIPSERANDGVLVFSFVGYKSTSIPIQGRKNIDVVLKEDQLMLEEVVITAIGISRERKQIGYALQDVKGDEIAQSREPNLINSLNAKVAGVQITSTSGTPGASAAIRIRGNSSIGGSNEPLFIVDGIPVDNAYRGSNFTDQANRLLDINPDDIEEITVLKGPAAAALYGINAANGAIIITTKKGKSGITEITFSTTLTLDQVNRLPPVQKVYSQGRNGQYRGPETGTRESWGARIEDLRFDGDASYKFDRRGRLVPATDPTATDMRAIAFDNAENFFITGVTSNSALSISSGNDRNLLHFSLGHLNQSGIVPKTYFQRTSLRLTAESKLSNRWTIAASVNYINSNANRSQRGSNLSGVMLGLMRAPASFDLSNGAKDPVNDPAAWKFPDGSQRTYFIPYDNPYWSVNKNRNLEDVDRIVGYTEVRFQATEWLQALWRLGLDQYHTRLKGYWDNYSGEFGTGRLYMENVTNSLLNSDLMLKINKELTKDVSLTAIAGHNYRYDSEYIWEFDGYTFVLPDFYDMSNIERQNIESLDDFLFRKMLVGLYADIQLGWKNFLFFNITGRNDWTSTLVPGKFSFFYPSVSTGFVFTEAFPHVSWRWLDFGKLRLSYARAANGAPSPYLTSNFFVLGTPAQGFLSYTPTSVLGNPNLRPEQKIAYEAGTDLRFFGNRLQFDITWYRNFSLDQIINLPVVPSTGFSAMVSNADFIEIVNHGWELVSTIRFVTPELSKHWRYDLTANFTRNRNIVNSLDGSEFNIALESTGLASTSSRVISGQPYGVLFGTAWQRDDQNRIIVNSQGYPMMAAQQEIIGDPNPDFLLGIRNRLSFKSVVLSFLIDIRRGGDIFNGTAGVMRRLGTHASTLNREQDIIFEGVLPDGTPNDKVIRLDENFYARYPLAGVSEASVERVDWIRLRDVNVTFTVPNRWVQSSKIKAASVTLTGRNLFLWTTYSGIDPETNLSGAGNAIGRDYFNNPNTRSIGLNMQLNF